MYNEEASFFLPLPPSLSFSFPVPHECNTALHSLSCRQDLSRDTRTPCFSCKYRDAKDDGGGRGCKGKGKNGKNKHAN